MRGTVRDLLRRTLVRYLVSLLLLAVLVTGSFLALAQVGAGLRQDGHLINVAGRQRMYSQQVALRVDAVAASTDAGRTAAQVELRATLAAMRGEHRALLEGDAALGLPTPSEEVRSWYTAAGGQSLGAELATFWAAADRVAAAGPGQDVAADTTVVADMASGDLLDRLDAVVTGYDRGSTAHLDRFHGLALATGALVLLGGAAVLLPLGASLRRERRSLVSARADTVRLHRFGAAVLEAVPTGVVACGPDGEVLLRNESHRRLLGPADHARPAEGPTVTLADGTVLDPADSPLGEALQGRGVHDLHVRVSAPGREAREVLVTAEQITDGEGAVLGAVMTHNDVTGERRVQDELREAASFHAAVLTATPDIVYVMDLASTRTVWTSRALEEVLGYTDADIAARGDRLYAELVHPDDVPHLLAANERVRALPDGGLHRVRYRARNAAGEFRVLSRRSTPFRRSADGAVDQVLSVARDVTEVAAAEDQLHSAARRDTLTGLPNRLHLAEVLADALRRATGPVAVLFCDLDGFKAVNDSAGHAAGDAVLVACARRMLGVLRSGDHVARVGGDEFVVVLAGDGRDPDGDALAAAGRIAAAIAEPVPVGDRTHRVTVSTGVTLAAPGADPDEVLSQADAAMYRAKELGRSGAAVLPRPRSQVPTAGGDPSSDPVDAAARMGS